MIKIKQYNQGQGLLETVFAIGILMIVVAAILALTSANVAGQRESEVQIIANNLAREGIEVVRNTRDSNWLAGIAWDDGLDGDGTAVPKFNYTANTWQLEFAPDDPTKIYMTPVGVYNQNSIGNPTMYSRLLTFQDICLDTDGSESISSNCTGAEKKIGLKVEALVEWTEKNNTRKIILEDLLYAWK